MIDLLTATQDAIYAAVAPAFEGTGTPVYQHVPENLQPPFVVIGSMDAETDGEKGDVAERHTVEIVSFYRGTARRELFAIMQRIRDALDGQSITAAGAELSRPRWLRSADDISEDGTTYQGLQHFEVIAQPAD